ncbi:protein sel-1 homolog 3-like isoform X1 [Chiloscyllium plagiosum]|uniref:protein sel-1 homolog 3-like isoform X1 n=1 Tax=Chiloscyllium plagiosum TaxID=36176 RepID=UPI001CB7D7D4|nr:protein sel-1 homolog 3-like isoform X1 [Chiloscyllium plagiosum]
MEVGMMSSLFLISPRKKMRQSHWQLCLGWLLILMPGSLHSAITTRTTSILKSSTDRHRNDFIRFINASDMVAANYKLSIDYLCSEPSTIRVEVIVSTSIKTGVVIYKKKWKCEKRLNILRNRTLWVKFPNIMLYRPDYVLRRSIVINNVMLRAWIINNGFEARENHNLFVYEQATTRTYKLLKTLSSFERPFKDHKECLQWDTEKIRAIKERKVLQCLLDNDVVELLRFPFASSGSNFGIVRKLKTFNNFEMEMTSKDLLNNPRFTVSIWLFLLHDCKWPLCGIFHHINDKQIYATPLLFLTQDGHIHFQMMLSSGTYVAGKSNFKLSLRRWCRLDFTLQDRRMTLSVSYGENLQGREDAVYNYPEDVHHNDSVGYFVLGGSNHVRGFEGFIGPVKLYRLVGLTVQKISNPLVTNHEIHKHIEQYYQKCNYLTTLIMKYFHSLGLHKKLQHLNQNNNYYLDLVTKYGPKNYDEEKCAAHTWGKRTEKKYEALFDLLQTMALEPILDFAHSPNLQSTLIKVGEKLFQKTVESLVRPDSAQHIGHLIASLMKASCCGYYRAAYFLAVIFETGLTVEIQPLQGMLYSLVAAQGNERLALMHLGYKHDQGIDGYPLDYDMSYGYYSNIAQQTVRDRDIFDGEQAFVETIRLMDDSALQSQTKENDDLFLWLRYQANRGDVFAQQKLARMLYWGQQGVTRDVKAALEWYSKSAEETRDPLSMYEYGLFLFKGKGVKKDVKLGLKLINEAASKGSHEAMNGLGWYYETFKKDYVKAVEYWEQAMKMGNLDALHNLGVMYESGLYPGKPVKNETEAFQYYYKAGSGGHFESVVRCSFYWSTGNFESIPHNPRMAVLWTRFVAENNGFLGYFMRKAMDAYLQKSWNEALLYFLVTAETGIETSQTNVAYFCEQHPDLTNSSDEYIWRYYNLSAFQLTTHPFVLIKMGDYYYYGHNNHKKDITQAIEMYTSAALLKCSQAFYNLGSLVEEGINIPEKSLDLLNIRAANHSKNSSILLELYGRCMTVDMEEGFVPCSIALLCIHLKTIWRNSCSAALLYTAGSVLLSTLIVFAVKRYWDTKEIVPTTGTNEHIPAMNSLSQNIQSDETVSEETSLPLTAPEYRDPNEAD